VGATGLPRPRAAVAIRLGQRNEQRSPTMSDTTTFTENPGYETTIAPHIAFGDMGVGNVKAALRLQTEVLDVLHDISRDWVARATSEAEFVFQLPNKLGAAQTVPDALTAYHEWLNEWMSMASEDHRRLVADSQRIMDKSVRCFAPASAGATT
jgi:hypothetical protein